MKRRAQILILVMTVAAISCGVARAADVAEADALRNQGRYDEAIAIYDQILKEYPENGPALYGKGVCLVTLGMSDQDITRLKAGRVLLIKVAEKYPTFGEYRHFNGYASLVLAQRLAIDDPERKKLLDLAEVEIKAALEAEKDASKKTVYKPSLAQVYKTAGKLKEARGLFEELARATPNPWYFFWLGEVAQAMGDEEGAITAFLDAMKGNPNFTNPMTPLSQIAVRRRDDGDYAGAAKLLKRIAAAKPHPFHHGWCLKYLADNRVDMGDNEGAIEALKEAERVYPNEANFPNRLGLIYLAVGNKNEAILAFKRAIQYNANLLYPYENLGNTLVSQNKIVEAREVYGNGLRAARNMSASAKRADLKAEADFYVFLFRWHLDRLGEY